MSRGRSGRLGAEFFEGGAVDVARRLLGCELVHDAPDGLAAGRIVEVEAYLGAGDDASHSRCGPTARNASMFLTAGHAYVYSIYGMHLCFNVVTGVEGTGEAVLVRALEPTRGHEHMRARRGREREKDWCSGPARLVQALAIRREQDGASLLDGALHLVGGSAPASIVRDRRIGIRRAAELPLRFCVEGSPWVSRPVAPSRRH